MNQRGISVLSDNELMNVAGGDFWGDVADACDASDATRELADAIDRQNNQLGNNRGGSGGWSDCGASRNGGNGGSGSGSGSGDHR